MEDAASIADGAEFWRWQLVELDQVLVCGNLGVYVAIFRTLKMLIETLEACIKLVSTRYIRAVKDMAQWLANERRRLGST